MARNRVARLNSLLQEVISEVIHKDVRNPHVTELVSVTQVKITSDLHYAKVYISVIGDQRVKEDTIKALQSAAGFIAIHSSKKVVMRYFPNLTFMLDTSVDKQSRIDEVLGRIREERKSRKS